VRVGGLVFFLEAHVQLHGPAKIADPAHHKEASPAQPALPKILVMQIIKYFRILLNYLSLFIELFMVIFFVLVLTQIQMTIGLSVSLSENRMVIYLFFISLSLLFG
jgi:hypothetical protein